MDQEFQLESDFGPCEVAEGEVDDDGKPRRTGTSFSIVIA